MSWRSICKREADIVALILVPFKSFVVQCLKSMMCFWCDFTLMWERYFIWPMVKLEIALLWCNHFDCVHYFVMNRGYRLILMLLVCAIFIIFGGGYANQTTQRMPQELLKISQGPRLWFNSTLRENALKIPKLELGRSPHRSRFYSLLNQFRSRQYYVRQTFSGCIAGV